jgi:hypothetical protein
VSTRPSVQPAPGPLTVDDARRDNRVGRAARLRFQHKRLRRQLDAANGRDAVRQIELVDVFGFGSLRVVPEMRVQIDEARQRRAVGICSGIAGPPSRVGSFETL